MVDYSSLLGQIGILEARQGLFGSLRARLNGARRFSTMTGARSQGYEDDELVRVVVSKTVIAVNKLSEVHDARFLAQEKMTAAVLAALLQDCSLPRVLDFGGGAGLYFHLVREWLAQEKRLLWTVIETERMVREAKESGLDSDDLGFVSALELVETTSSVDREFNIVFANASLQYLKNPRDTLVRLSQLRPRFIFIARALLSGGDRVTTHQKSLLSENGPGDLPVGYKNRKVVYPVTINTLEELASSISPEYRLLVARESEPNPVFVSGQKVSTFDLVFELDQ